MIDWDEINTVFLDMDGTLLDLRFDNFFWKELLPSRFAEEKGIALESAKDQLASLFVSREGLLQWYCLDYWSDRLKLDLIALKTEVSDQISVLPHAIDFLVCLRDLGKRVVLVTNAHPFSLNLKLERTQLDGYFDATVCAHSLGLAKEQDSFWESLATVELFECRNTLMVDDSLPVLHAAKRHGIGNLVAVRLPDSTLASGYIDDFRSIRDFREISPG